MSELKPRVERIEPGHADSGGRVIIEFDTDDEMRRILSAIEDTEADIAAALERDEPFCFDPATGFVHADDGGAPEHGHFYVPKDTRSPDSELKRLLADGPEDFDSLRYHIRRLSDEVPDTIDAERLQRVETIFAALAALQPGEAS